MMDPKMTMDVPRHVRELGVTSLDQAVAAFSTFMESANKSVALVPGPMTDVAKQALQITDKNLKASFDHARRLMRAKDINEVMGLQSEFLRSLYGTATQHFKEMAAGGGDTSQDLSKEKPESI